MFPQLYVSPSVSAAMKKTEKKEATPEELQERIQTMIDLQRQAATADAAGVETVLEGSAPPPPPYKTPPNTEAGTERGVSLRNEAAAAAAAASMGADEDEDGVGQGQLLFPSDYPRPPPPLSETNPMLLGSDYASYGGATTTNTTTTGLMPHQTSLTPDDPDEHHLYHHPDYHHDSDAHHHHHHRRRDTSCGCFVSLCRCFVALAQAETLHRSFCFGAIDGMLTGSGIVAAFVGMGILSHLSTLATKLFVVGFCLAACCSDATCVALGHVWSTYVMTQQSAKERRSARLSFETNRADAKGKLVDMLLSRGMLKIDAMSIADTLEGYPDIFVSSIVGDSGYTLGDDVTLKPSDGSIPQTSLYTAPRSYGSYNEWEYDPEAAGVAMAMHESRMEAFFMMLSFALFSVLPALIYLVFSLMIDETNGVTVSVKSMSMSMTSLIMVLLGIWKSKFFDSNWALFGIETVMVLFLCVIVAFTLGVIMSSVIPTEGLFSNTIHHEATSTTVSSHTSTSSHHST